MNKKSGSLPLWKMMVSALALICQFFLLFLVVAGTVVNLQGRVSAQDTMVIAYNMIFLVLMQFPIVLLRWWLKSVSWGTFAVLAAQLAAASYYRGLYHYIYKEEMWVYGFVALTAISIMSALFFFDKNIRHTTNLLKGKSGGK